jgi:hypothetical protein
MREQQYEKEKSAVYSMQMSHACSSTDPPSNDPKIRFEEALG